VICEALYSENRYRILFCFDEEGNIKKRYWIVKPRNEKEYYQKYGYKAIHPEDRGWHSRLFKRNLTRAEISKRYYYKQRRNLGLIPLNEPFKNSVGHHIDKNHVIYIPKELHKGYHCLGINKRGRKNMELINMRAIGFLLWTQCLSGGYERPPTLGKRAIRTRGGA